MEKNKRLIEDVKQKNKWRKRVYGNGFSEQRKRIFG